MPWLFDLTGYFERSKQLKHSEAFNIKANDKFIKQKIEWASERP